MLGVRGQSPRPSLAGTGTILGQEPHFPPRPGPRACITGARMECGAEACPERQRRGTALPRLVNFAVVGAHHRGPSKGDGSQSSPAFGGRRLTPPHSVGPPGGIPREAAPGAGHRRGARVACHQSPMLRGGVQTRTSAWTGPLAGFRPTRSAGKGRPTGQWGGSAREAVAAAGGGAGPIAPGIAGRAPRLRLVTVRLPWRRRLPRPAQGRPWARPPPRTGWPAGRPGPHAAWPPADHRPASPSTPGRPWRSGSP